VIGKVVNDSIKTTTIIFKKKNQLEKSLEKKNSNKNFEPKTLKVRTERH